MTSTGHASLALRFASLAEHIVDTVEETDYQHHAVIDPDKGIYLCDCNGFVGYILETDAPDHYALVPKEPDQIRPRAFKYHDFFASLATQAVPGWARIERLADARRGDLIAWRFPEIELGHDTGHVLVVSHPPVSETQGTAAVFAVSIYDLAAQPHFADTRGRGEDQFATGVGTGTIYFQVDQAGRPTSFQFSPGDKFAVFPIAIGRAEPFSL